MGGMILSCSLIPNLFYTESTSAFKINPDLFLFISHTVCDKSIQCHLLKRKTPSVSERIYHTHYFSLYGGSFIQLLCQTGLFPVGGILVNYALGCGLVDHGGSRGQLLIGVGRISGYGSIKLADGCTHTALHDTIAKILLLADLDAFLGGLDIRQLGSPPLRILKKPSHGIISCLRANCNPFIQKIYATALPI